MVTSRAVGPTRAFDDVEVSVWVWVRVLRKKALIGRARAYGLDLFFLTYFFFGANLSDKIITIN